MFFKFHLSLIFCFVFLTIRANAQENNSDTKTENNKKALAIVVQPMFGLLNIVKVEAEYQNQEKPFTYVAGLEIFTGKLSEMYPIRDKFGEAIFDKTRGFGLNAVVRYKFGAKNFTHYYLQSGLRWQNLQITLDGKMYHGTKIDGLDYIVYGPHQQIEKIHPWMIYAGFGRYLAISNIVVDFNFGVAYKFLNQNSNLINQRRYHDFSYGYNYKGFTPYFEIKLGYQFTK